MGVELRNDSAETEKRSSKNPSGFRGRVDYSARCSFIHDPDLKLHQCGLPKTIVLQLYRPFIVRRMLEMRLAYTREEAEAILLRPVQSTGKFSESTWLSTVECDQTLEAVIAGHPVLLSRAPSLSQTGIQAFQPVITAGNVIRIHPLVFQDFDSEKDGDQVTVHLPLSREAQREASTRMMPANNLFSPANGAPIFSPSRDIVMGCYYVTLTRTACDRPKCLGDGMIFASPREVDMAYALGKVALHATVKVRLPKNKRIRDGHEQKISSRGIIETTAGRILFNEILPPQMAFYDQALNRKDLAVIIADCYGELGQSQTIELMEQITQFGVRELTRSGCSVAVSDLKMAKDKATLIAKAEKQTAQFFQSHQRGIMARQDRDNSVFDVWQIARVSITRLTLASLDNDESAYINPLSLMMRSGAGISTAQILRFAGMYGSASSYGSKFEIPIKSNFREGLSLVEYFMSIIQPRKNRLESLKSSRSWRFLARKLVQACRHLVITEHDCGTSEGIKAGAAFQGTRYQIRTAEAIVGRVSLKSILDPMTGETIVQKNELVTPEIALRIEAIGLEEIVVRSPLTCQTEQGVCRCCYGWDLLTASLVDVGVRVGMIAAHSLCKSPFNILKHDFRIRLRPGYDGESKIFSWARGVVRFSNARIVKNSLGASIVMSHNATAAIYGDNDRWLEEYDIPVGAELHVAENERLKLRQLICSWNFDWVPILSNASGRVHLEEVVEGVTSRTEKELNGNVYERILNNASNLNPRILIKDSSGKVMACHYMPVGTCCELVDNQLVTLGEILASYPRIVQPRHCDVIGISRIVELLKAKKLPSSSTLAQCDGEVEISAERTPDKRMIVVRTKEGKEVIHLVSPDAGMRVRSKDQVFAGDPLTFGTLDPNDVLSILGEKAAQRLLLEDLWIPFSWEQHSVDARHLEVVVSQMMSMFQIDDPGDSSLSQGELVDRVEFKKINQILQSSARVIDPGDSELRAGDVVNTEFIDDTNRELNHSNKQDVKIVKARPATEHVRILGIEEVAKQRDAVKSDHEIVENGPPNHPSTNHGLRVRKSNG